MAMLNNQRVPSQEKTKMLLLSLLHISCHCKSKAPVDMRLCSKSEGAIPDSWSYIEKWDKWWSTIAFSPLKQLWFPKNMITLRFFNYSGIIVRLIIVLWDHTYCMGLFVCPGPALVPSLLTSPARRSMPSAKPPSRSRKSWGCGEPWVVSMETYGFTLESSGKLT